MGSEKTMEEKYKIYVDENGFWEVTDFGLFKAGYELANAELKQQIHEAENVIMTIIINSHDIQEDAARKYLEKYQK